MSEKFNLGDQVVIAGKDLKGRIAFLGETEFSAGKWIGVVLTEPKGKNNGTVQGKSYFECEENFGLFVRETQLQSADPTTGVSKLTKSGSTPSKIATPSASKSKLPGLKAGTGSRIPSAPGALSALGSGLKRPSLSRDVKSPKPSSGIRKPRVSPSTNLTESSSAESLGAISLMSESSENAAPITKIEEDEEHGVNFAAHGQLLKEISEENRKLKRDVEELTSQLDSMKERRQADKEKLKELEKLRIMNEQLQEFKMKMLEQHGQLKMELQKSQEKEKEALLAKQGMDESAKLLELQENLEMAVLDKEMAEEKAEEMLAELQQARDEVDEVRTELEILKAERESQGLEGSVSGDAAANKALEDQNRKLRETLIRLRDLSAQDRHNMTKVERSLEEEKARNADLSSVKAKLDEKVIDLEKQIQEFHEQLDAAMGAEEMVVNLTEKVLTLEERVNQMEDERQELERDYQLTQELVEAQNEAEKEFRDEIATLQSKISLMDRAREEAKQVIQDKEGTILKFREYVSQLNEKIEHLSRENVEKDKLIQEKAAALQAVRTLGTTTEMAGFKVQFEESRGKTRALEIELLKMDVDLARKHVYYLSKFVPANFLMRGGDSDAINLLLLIPRLMRKCDILTSAAKDNFHVEPEGIQEALNSAASLLKTHSVDRASFGFRLGRLVLGITGVLRQCQIAMDHCSVDSFVRMAGFFPEFSLQERNMDFYLDLLRKDQLDENVPLEGAERAFTQLCQLLYGSMSEVINSGREKPLKKKEDNFNWITDDLWLQDSCKTFLSATECVTLEVSRIKCLMVGNSESSEMGLLLKELYGHAEDAKNSLRRILRLLPSDGTSRQPISLDRNVREVIRNTHGRLDLVVLALHDIAKSSLEQVLSYGGVDHGLTSDKLKELTFAAIDKAAQKCLLKFLDSNDADLSLLGGPLVTLRQFLSTTDSSLSDLSDNLSQGKYDMGDSGDDSGSWREVTSPIELRAVMIKDEMKDAENLRSKLEMRDQDIKELKKHLKQKQDEMSELVVRRDMAEKKLSLLAQEKCLSEERWNRRLEDSQTLMSRKEKEYEELMNQLQKDVDALASEKHELKARLLAVDKFRNLEGKIGTLGSPTGSVPPMSLPAVASTALTSLMSPIMASSPLPRPGLTNLDQLRILEEERDALRRQLRWVSEENELLKFDQMRDKVAQLKPLAVPKHEPDVHEELRRLKEKSERLLGKIHETAILPLIDLSKRHGGEIPVTDLTWPAAELARRERSAKRLRDALDTLKHKALNLEIAHGPAGTKEGGGKTFAKPELGRVIKERELTKGGGLLFARLKLKLPPNESSGETVKLHLNGNELRRLFGSLVP